MWTSSRLLITALPFFLCIFSSKANFIKQENSLGRPFEAGIGSLLFWERTGQAQLDSNFIRLTSDKPGQQGGIWNTPPLIGNDFEVQVVFGIHGKGVHLNGDGLAIWYVREPAEIGPVFGYKDYFTGLGVFIDTFQSHADPQKPPYPYVYAMVNNGSLHYANEEDGAYTHVGGCHVPVRNADYLTRIAVSYSANTLTIYVDTEGLAQWKPCFSVPGVHLPTGYYIGMTASTGQHSDNHDIFAVTTLNLSPEKPFEDTSSTIPQIENFIIPVIYNKEYIEKKQKEEVQEKKREQQIDEMIEKIQHKEDDEKEEKVQVPPPTSLPRKLIYILGTAIILIIAISMCRKYQAQRHERMQKRLY